MKKKRRQVRSKDVLQWQCPGACVRLLIAHYALQVTRWLVPHSAIVSLADLQAFSCPIVLASPTLTSYTPN